MDPDHIGLYWIIFDHIESYWIMLDPDENFHDNDYDLDGDYDDNGNVGLTKERIRCEFNRVQFTSMVMAMMILF